MKYYNYLKEKMLLLSVTAAVQIFILFMGKAFGINTQFLGATIFLNVMVIILYINIVYLNRISFYNNLQNCLDKLDQKYLIAEMIKKPDFEEGRILYDTLYETDKSMKENINRLEISMSEFKEYMEMWIHEIKAPIAALNLMNYNGNTDLQKQKKQIDRINYYVEQILFYARGDAAEKDFLMKACNLEKIINKAVMDQKALLIGNKITIEKENVDIDIITDSKWMEYMLSQIVNNSIKYADSTRKSYIRFTAAKYENQTILSVRDNGIGISSADLPYVFDKTFTGTNGRQGNTSTGMGLYICKKLITKLGHKISVSSEEGKGTRVDISFGNNEFVKLE